MMMAELPYKSEPNIKDNSAIVYLVGANKLNPLQSVSVRKLISNDGIIVVCRVLCTRTCA